MPRKQESLVRPGEPKQHTRSGLEIPVPKRSDFFGMVDKAATTRPAAPVTGARPEVTRLVRWQWALSRSCVF